LLICSFLFLSNFSAKNLLINSHQAHQTAAMWLPSLGRGRLVLNRMGKIFLNYRRTIVKLCGYLVNCQNGAHQIRSRIDASRGTNSTMRLLIPSKVTFQPSS
jgi:hypothetical protein